MPDSSVLPDSFYRDLGDGRFESTHATVGPWSANSQHAGPPSALLGRALERHEARDDLRVARVTLEIPRPVPVGELCVSARTVRSGKRSELLEADITADGKPVMLARAWRIARSPRDTPRLRSVPDPPPVPDASAENATGGYGGGYISAIEWRRSTGGFDVPGPGTTWARQRVPLVAGDPDTPLIRALTLADSNWAVGMELDLSRQLVINTDVTLALHSEPTGEWLCLHSATSADPDGSALATGQLHDTTGHCGRILQTLLVAER